MSYAENYFVQMRLILTLGAPVETVVSFDKKSLSTAESSCGEAAKAADTSPRVLHGSTPTIK